MAVVNIAAVNGGCSYFFLFVFLFSSDKYPEVGLLGHIAVLFLIFWGSFILFFKVATLTDIPASCTQGFPFYHILTMCYLLSSFFSCYSIRVVPIFPPLPSSTQPTPAPTVNPHTIVCPWVIHSCSLTAPFPVFPPFSPPLWLLSICSMFPCFRFYFAYKFILFIRFLL